MKKWIAEVYQTYKVERFPKLVNSFKTLTIFVKGSTLDVRQDSEYA